MQHTTNKNHQLEVQLGGTVTLQCPQGSLGCWSHLDPINQRLRGLGVGSSIPTGIFSLKDVVYQDAGTYKCVGQNPNNKKKLDVLHTLSLNVKGKRNHFCSFFVHKLLSKYSLWIVNCRGEQMLYFPSSFFKWKIRFRHSFIVFSPISFSHESFSFGFSKMIATC